jgi:hypothetical protein
MSMRIRFVRHATFVFEAGGRRVMVDPMLAPAGATDPVANTPNQRRNPLVDLPFGEEGMLALLEATDAVLVTHTHTITGTVGRGISSQSKPPSCASRRIGTRSAPPDSGVSRRWRTVWSGAA